MKERTVFTLKELLSSLQRCIDNSFSNSYWIKAEISDFKVSAINGHCYMELIEKGVGGNIIAKVRANIWNYSYERINNNFIQSGLSPLSSGVSVLCLVKVTYHIQYGLSLTIDDVDTQYSLGEIAKLRQETISRLKKNGLYNLNKTLSLPRPIKRIALISSKNAAGKEDFMTHIRESIAGRHLQIALFTAQMQGEEVTSSVINAFELILKHIKLFDCVVIIRGGGAISELRAFDDYALCEYISKFPIPVISGIGHEKDVSVLDLIANTSLKTPTAVAEFLINNIMCELESIDMIIKALTVKTNQITLNTSVRLAKKTNILSDTLKSKLYIQKNNIDGIKARLSIKCKTFISNGMQSLEKKHNSILLYSKSIISSKTNRLQYIYPSIRTRISNIMNINRQKLDSIKHIIELSDPKNIIKKGYSLVYKNGKVVTSVSETRKNSKLTIYFKDGDIDVLTQNINDKRNEMQ